MGDQFQHPFAKMIHLWFSALLCHGCFWALLKCNFRRKAKNPMTAWSFCFFFGGGGRGHRSLLRVRFSKDESSLPFLYLFILCFFRYPDFGNNVHAHVCAHVGSLFQKSSLHWEGVFPPFQSPPLNKSTNKPKQITTTTTSLSTIIWTCISCDGAML